MNRMRFTGLVLLIVCAELARAALPGSERVFHAAPAHASVTDSTRHFDTNKLSMVVTNKGSFAYDKLNGGAGLEFPKGSGKTAVFAGGLWLGALVSGGVRVSVSEYADNHHPGAVLPNGQPDDSSKAE